MLVEARELAVGTKERQHRRVEAASLREHLHALAVGIVSMAETIATKHGRLAESRLLLFLLGLLTSLLV